MPEYTYTDESNHKYTFEMSLEEYDKLGFVKCPICTAQMYRAYKVPAINWNGLPPHEADARSPEIQQLLGTANERRAQYADTKAKINGEK
jgi:predicted nucleic acid-binding Zn ribbon protein